MNEQVVPERASSPIETPVPEILETPSALSTPTSDLPPIAEDADDLRMIKQAVGDAASIGGALWLSYLFVLFYFAVATGAVTHADLFLENPVKLPFLNIELPLLGFFVLAPILFVGVHAYALVHLVMLTDKAKRFHQALYDQIGDKNGQSEQEAKKRSLIRDGLRRQLPSNIFIQFLAGPLDRREGLFGWLLITVAWITLVIAPVLLLLLMQVQFLPFHSSFVTWTHRVALLADLALIWWLWPAILAGRRRGSARRWAWWTWSGVGSVLSACTLLFSWALATFPDEWHVNYLPTWRPVTARVDEGSGEIRLKKASLHDLLFALAVDDTTQHRTSPFSNTLVLPGMNIYEDLGISDPDKVRWRDYIFRARGRDLKGAILDQAILSRVDFQGAQLQGASLNGAELTGASLDYADLEGASLFRARLQGASLDFADLGGSMAASAQLQGASLLSTELRGAFLESAKLQGARLQGASLDGADLGGASLDGADLQSASLKGASLDGADLQGALLFDAQLQGASLGRGVSYTPYSRLEVIGKPQSSNLRAVDLRGALLWRSATPRDAPVVAAVMIGDSPSQWLPSQYSRSEHPVQSWNEEAYQSLRRTIASLPLGRLRDAALDRVHNLDCANLDPTLASCDPSSPPPPEAIAWRKSLEDARVDKVANEQALSAVLQTLVCSGDPDATYVLRGLLATERLKRAGSGTQALTQIIMSKDCPVSASLADTDKANLLQVERDAIRTSGQ
jgi:uncharacterized protein YjbI with pentapeptide repeats